MRVLVVEDEKDMNITITKKLEAEGYNVDACFDGDAALEYMQLADYDGVILDVMLPGKNGFEVLQQARAMEIRTPVMFLSAKDDIKDIVRGLDSGADDYMVKPFSFTEMLARLRVLLRKPLATGENVFRCGDLAVDINRQRVTRAGDLIELSPKEYAILLFLVRNKNQVVSREQIESNIWNIRNETSSNVVDVYIRYLRRKVDDAYPFKMIRTVRGTGYMMVDNEEE